MLNDIKKIIYTKIDKEISFTENDSLFYILEKHFEKIYNINILNIKFQIIDGFSEFDILFADLIILFEEEYNIEFSEDDIEEIHDIKNLIEKIIYLKEEQNAASETW